MDRLPFTNEAAASYAVDPVGLIIESIGRASGHHRCLAVTKLQLKHGHALQCVSSNLAPEVTVVALDHRDACA